MTGPDAIGEMGAREVIKCMAPPRAIDFWREHTLGIVNSCRAALEQHGVILESQDIQRIMNRILIQSIEKDIEWSENGVPTNSKVGHKFLEMYVYREDWRGLLRMYGVGFAPAAAARLVTGRLYHLVQERANISDRICQMIVRRV